MFITGHKQKDIYLITETSSDCVLYTANFQRLTKIFLVNKSYKLNNFLNLEFLSIEIYSKISL